MKNALFLLSCLLILGCKTPLKDSFLIQGNIEGIENDFVVLHYKNHSDTTLVKNGKFSFKGKLKQPLPCTIEFVSSGQEKAFYLENSKIKFIANSNDIANGSITGSQLHLEYLEYKNILNKIDLKYRYDEINNEWDSANTQRRNELELIFSKYDQEILNTKKQFVIDHPGSYYSPIILFDIDWSFENSKEFFEFISVLDPKLDSFSYLIKIKEVFQRLKNVEVGKKAPDFTMNNTEDDPVMMSSLLKSNKYLLIDFWASSCGSCRKENKNMLRAYRKFHDKGLNILSISTDFNKNDWLNAIKQDSLEWINVCDFTKWNKNEIVQLYALRQSSENLLLDSTGLIIAKNIKGEELQSKLTELFN